MFSRHGGCSRGRYSSLNISYTVGDTPSHVAWNRDRIKEALGLKCLVSARQVHGNRVQMVSSADHDRDLGPCDALMTSLSGVGLLIQQADCQAILVHDPVHHAVAAIHNGWRGSVQNIIHQTISAMRQHFGTEPSMVFAAISPSLGPCCAEFTGYRQLLPTAFHAWKKKNNYFDFWQISQQQLSEAGVRRDRIDILQVCTKCCSDFFSHRRATEQGLPVTGRQGSVIALPDDGRHPAGKA